MHARRSHAQGPKFLASSSGTHTFCFDNRMAKWTAKVVTFELTVADPNRVPEAAIPVLSDKATEAEATAHTLATIKSASARLHEKLLKLENSQQYHFHREVQHRDTAESTFTRITWWSVGESVIVIGASLLQVFMLRTWISKGLAARNSYLNSPRASGV